MLRTVLWQIVIVAVVASGICLDGKGGVGLFGVGSAEAKEYYTKKRVNGRWISGRFPKRSTVAQSPSVRPSADAPSAPKAALTFAAAEQPGNTAVTLQAAPAVRFEPTVPASRPAPDQTPGPISQARPVLPAGNAPLDPAAESERLDKLRQALQARASALTAESGAPQQGALRTPEPQSVSLDFQSGIKTTRFSDGTMVNEPFDVAALKTLAAVPAEAKAARP